MDVQAAALASQLSRVQAGEVRVDTAARRLYASDASHFRIVPTGVVTPRGRDDVEAVLRTCAEHGVPVTARGAGTSLAGNAIGSGIVVDLSRHLTHVGPVDPTDRTVRVHAGAVLDDVRRAANAHGLTFGPDPSTANRCTIGGMVGNNACGAHSLTSGRTSDNVTALRVVLADGRPLDTARPSHLDEPLRAIGLEVADEVARRHPPIPRRVSGYNLGDLHPDRWDLASFLVGTEGTLAVVVEADLRLVPWRPSRALAVLAHPDAPTAADHVPGLLASHAPVALEGIDGQVVEGARHRGAAGTAMLPWPAHGREGSVPTWLLVEFDGDDPAEAEAAAAACVASASSQGVPGVVVADPVALAALWQVRSAGLGAVTFVTGERARIGGWEDAAVAPDRLGDYLRGFNDLVAEHGLSIATYGHFGDGCVHTKIGFDHVSPDGRARFRSFVQEAADLAVAHGGSLSGEHGDGRSRSELLERMLGAELVDAHRRVKAVFDPAGLLNPGVVVDPDPLDGSLRLADRREALARPGLPTLGTGDPEAEAHRCIGMGACRRDDDHGTMCPTYRVTRDEDHSTRGRARLLQEALRGDGLAEDDAGVVASLDLCLSCRGCATDCPVDVDVATMKATWNQRRWRGRRRPAVHWALGMVPRALRAASRRPMLANALLRSPAGSALRRSVGITTSRPPPRLPRQSFRTWWERRGGSRGDGPPVVLFADTFSAHLDPAVLQATVRVLEATGHRVVVPDGPLCCGRTLVDPGMLDRAARTVGEAVDRLAAAAPAGTPIVAVEPSCAAMLADEAVGLLADDPVARATARRVARATRTLAGFLVDVDWSPPRLERDAVVHGHCHQHASLRFDAEAHLLDRMGLRWRDLDAGCCGMAGGFGFEAGRKFELSVEIGESRLLPEVRSLDPSTLVLADGFSCRTQLEHLQSLRRPWHLARLLDAALDADEPGAAPVPADEPPAP